jgi:hypothetical protein
MAMRAALPGDLRPLSDPAAGSIAIRYTVLVEKDGIETPPYPAEQRPASALRLVEGIQHLVPASCGGDDGVGIDHGSERLTKV